MRIPKHVGIIPDGNRRWARGRGLSKSEGYAYGLKPGLAALHFAQSAGIEELTYYGFTTDNCGRPPEQIEAFCKACTEAVKLISEERVSLLVVGDTSSKYFPKELLPFTEKRREQNGGGIRVNFLVNYGWQWDLKNAGCGSVDRREILSSLQSHDISYVDLLVRWGGMRRLSGFLPVQSVYADFYIADALWPDFTEADFSAALKWYAHQDVTRGG